jgi:8-oxo-dGTP diphosphatase
MTERPAGKHLTGAWVFPSGKIEPDETPREGLARGLAPQRAWARGESGIHALAG